MGRWPILIKVMTRSCMKVMITNEKSFWECNITHFHILYTQYRLFVLRSRCTFCKNSKEADGCLRRHSPLILSVVVCTVSNSSLLTKRREKIDCSFDNVLWFNQNFIQKKVWKNLATNNASMLHLIRHFALERHPALPIRTMVEKKLWFYI